ncbi:uncharacterized protein LOC123319431 [Coccinella septempunctata]|uniref:uncharacterized protein LOC123319431 n=1 Tax=Coccinella septempunctata TaxID=41139 RepID=UPI001D098FC2|nr:uncharacterized protein LOC123319431 [Coccinella septempunctata]
MKELSRLFRTYCSQQHSRWAYEVPKIQEILNEVVHESTGFSPRELQFGTPRLRLLPDNLIIKNRVEPSLDVKLRLASICLSKRASKRATRNPGKKLHIFDIGDLVLLRANNSSSAIKSEIKKFLLLFEGPFRIKKKIHDHTYLLSLPNSDEERGIFHSSHLKLYSFPTYAAEDC